MAKLKEQQSIRQAMIDAGVRHLHEFGYPDCNAENVLTDDLYKAFFRKMVIETKREPRASIAIIAACAKLLKDME